MFAGPLGAPCLAAPCALSDETESCDAVDLEYATVVEGSLTLVVSPDEVADATPRDHRGAFSELLDSNAALLEELGVV